MRFIAGLIMVVGVSAGSGWQTPALAQSASRPCVNESLDIDIHAQPMEAALHALSRQTHCPISGTAHGRGLTSNAVRGVYTPMAALTALVEHQGMSTRAIRQGFSVSRVTPSPRAAPSYSCQNDSIEIHIAAMPLEEALNALSDATHCPISRSFAVSGLRSRSVNGHFTPPQALQALLIGTGLQGQVIRQGLTVVPGPR